MRLLRTDCEELRLDTFNDERQLPKYAILSHVWLAAEEEVTFQDVKVDPQMLQERAGWAKLDFTKKQAQKDGYLYCWIDTCCIDKSSSAELGEAINSMFRWYSTAEVCYVYLADMPGKLTIARRVQVLSSAAVEETHAQSMDIEIQIVDERLPLISSSIHPSNTTATFEEQAEWNWEAFRDCKWFTRGWTLQEMIAPTTVEFFTASWDHIGPLSKVAHQVADITGVHVEVLLRMLRPSAYSIAQKMSWAAHRVTTKVEDQAYCLLGIFDLNLPVIYGEGEKAFQRLQMELLRTSPDQTIFAWLAMANPNPGFKKTNPEFRVPSDYLQLFARSPEAFKACARVICLEPDDRAHESTDNGARFTLPSVAWYTRRSDLKWQGDIPHWRESNGLHPKYWNVEKYIKDPATYPMMLAVVLKCCFQISHLCRG